ncbi:hypothetical protein IV102_19365 [bacterium]|nr:hypothetical protein [bacterium]
MPWKILLLIGLMAISLAAQDLPKCKTPLPSRAEICRMGWPKFEMWCLENVEGGEAGIDAMALHYRDLRDEATANQANRLTGPETLQLDAAVKAITNWLFARSVVGGACKGGSIYSHLGPRLTAQLADVKHECVLDWSTSADAPTNQWPQSYEDMASQPLVPLAGDPKAFKAALKQEASSLQEASRQVRRLRGSARQKLQKFMLSQGENLDPNSRTKMDCTTAALTQNTSSTWIGNFSGRA